MTEWIALFSIVLLGEGLYMIYQPLGLIVPAIIIFIICILAIRNKNQ